MISWITPALVRAASMQPKPKYDGETLMVAALTAILICSVILSASAHKVLAADGAYYVLQMADTRDFFLVGWHRHHAQYLTQFVPVMSAKLFGADVGTVEILYTVSICLVFLGSIILALRWTRGLRALFAVYAISLMSINIFSDYIFMGEHQVMALLAWPILIFALNQLPTSTNDRAMVIFCALVIVRSYEASAIVLTLPFIGCVLRIIKSRAANRSETYFWITLAAILFVGMAVGVHGILNPRDPTNMSGFAGTALVSLSAPTTLASLVFLVCYILATFIAVRVTVAVTFGAALLGLGWAWQAGGPPDAWQSFSGRNLTVTLLPALMAFTAAISLSAVRKNVRLLSSATIFCLGLAIIAAVGQLQWMEAQEKIKIETAQSQGFVSFETAPLSAELLFPYWTLPTLSILLQPSCVASIILPPANYPWQPFDPRAYHPLKGQRRFDGSVGGKGC